MNVKESERDLWEGFKGGKGEEKCYNLSRGKAAPACHQLQHSGEQTLHLVWAIQQSQLHLQRCGRASSDIVSMDELSRYSPVIR